MLNPPNRAYNRPSPQELLDKNSAKGKPQMHKKFLRPLASAIASRRGLPHGGSAWRALDFASRVSGRSYRIGLGSRRVPRYWAEIDSGHPPGLFPERLSPETE